MEPFFNRPRPKRHSRRICFYVTGRIEGKMTLLGPYDTREEADERGFTGFPDDQYEVHEIATPDRKRATQILKHRLFEGTGNLGDSLKPIKHTIRGM